LELIKPHLPVAVLSALAVLVLMGGLVRRFGSPVKFLPYAAVASLGVVLALLYVQGGSGFAHYARFAVCLVGLLILLAQWEELDRDNPAEFLSAVLFSLAGVMLVVSAEDLIVLFLGLEMVSLPTYLLVSVGRSHLESQEAGNKYFFLSVLAASVLLYGMSFLYGTTGTVRLYDANNEVRVATQKELVLARSAFEKAHHEKAKDVSVKEAALRRAEAREADTVGIGSRISVLVREGPRGSLPMLAFGAFLLIFGLCFKLAAFPFHFYAPDVYQGTSHSIAGMMAFVPKAAGLFAMIKLVSVPLVSLIGSEGNLSRSWFELFWVLAVGSMTVGNVLGLLQNNIKRMLAYSSIAHSGYLLIAVTVLVGRPGSSEGLHPNDNPAAAALFYILAYGLMTLGAFAALSMVRTGSGEPAESLDDVSGLARKKPGAALALAVFMFSLTGLPPTAGFLGKLSLFSCALNPGDGTFGTPHYWLVGFGVLNSAISAYYYLGVVGAMYLREPVGNVETSTSFPLRLAVGICAALTLAWGVAPQGLMNFSVAAARTLVSAPPADDATHASR